MNYIDKDAFLRLIQECLNEQGSEDEIEKYLDAEHKVEKIKEKIKYNDNVVDLTNTKKDKIEEFISQKNHIKVGDFLIKIKKYNGYNRYSGIRIEKETTTDIFIYEIKPNSKMHHKINVRSDTRFNTQLWIKYFNNFSAGNDIPLAVIKDIVRWLQALTRMGAFA